MGYLWYTDSLSSRLAAINTLFQKVESTTYHSKYNIIPIGMLPSHSGTSTPFFTTNKRDD